MLLQVLEHYVSIKDRLKLFEEAYERIELGQTLFAIKLKNFFKSKVVRLQHFTVNRKLTFTFEGFSEESQSKVKYNTSSI